MTRSCAPADEQVRRSSGGNAVLSISARVDYGVRALCALAVAEGPVTSVRLADAHGIPHKFLEAILTDLRRGDLLVSKRGLDGGYRLARPAHRITLSDVIDSLVGTLAEVRGQLPESTSYVAPAEHLQAVWLDVRDQLRSTLDRITIDDVVSGNLPHPDPSSGSRPLSGTRWFVDDPSDGVDDPSDGGGT